MLNLKTSEEMTRRDFGRGLAAILAAGVAPALSGDSTGGLRRGLGMRLAGMGGGGEEEPLWIWPTARNTDWNAAKAQATEFVPQIPAWYLGSASSGYISRSFVYNNDFEITDSYCQMKSGTVYYGMLAFTSIKEAGRYRVDYNYTGEAFSVVLYERIGEKVKWKSIKKSVYNMTSYEFDYDGSDLVALVFAPTTMKTSRVSDIQITRLS